MRPGPPTSAPLKMKCSPIKVLPEPDGPATSVDRARPKTGAQRLIQKRDARGDPLGLLGVAGPARQGRPASGRLGGRRRRADIRACRAEATPPELQDLEDPSFAVGVRLDGERDYASTTANSGATRCLPVVFTDPQRRGGVGGQLAREIMEEAPERRRVRGERMQCLEAVDHEQPRSSFAERSRPRDRGLGQRV